MRKEEHYMVHANRPLYFSIVPGATPPVRILGKAVYSTHLKLVVSTWGLLEDAMLYLHSTTAWIY